MGGGGGQSCRRRWGSDGLGSHSSAVEKNGIGAIIHKHRFSRVKSPRGCHIGISLFSIGTCVITFLSYKNYSEFFTLTFQMFSCSQ